jgi:foldase protein PrsA
MVGTAGALMFAVIGLQFLRPEPAVSQTREPAAKAGTAKVEVSAPPKGEPLARVNNQNITWDVVAAECMEQHAKETLDDIISRLLIHQACQAQGIAITEQEIQREVVEFARRMKVPTETWYQLMQSQRNLTPAQYHRTVIWPMLALKKLAGTEVQITEEELQQAFIRDYGPRVEARMILVEGNVRQATQIWEQAKADPENFSRLASEVSAEPNSRALGGQIPPIRRFASPPNSQQAKVEEHAFGMQPGEISPVMQIDDKFVILRCEKQTQPVVTDIEQVRGDLTEQLKELKVQEGVGKKFAEIKAKAEIHNFLTGDSTTGTAGGVQQTSGTQTKPAARPASGTQPSGAARPAVAAPRIAK